MGCPPGQRQRVLLIVYANVLSDVRKLPLASFSLMETPAAHPMHTLPNELYLKAHACSERKSEFRKSAAIAHV